MKISFFFILSNGFGFYSTLSFQVGFDFYGFDALNDFGFWIYSIFYYYTFYDASLNFTFECYLFVFGGRLENLIAFDGYNSEIGYYGANDN